MKKQSIFLFVLGYLVFGIHCAVFAEPSQETPPVEKHTQQAYMSETGEIMLPELLSEGAVLINVDTGEILYQKNMNQTLFPASTTKVMTAILALENGDLNEQVFFTESTVSGFPWASSSIGMKPGEILTLDQALNGLMISSANEVAKGIAEHIAGNEAAFVAMMNRRAAELGAENTHFANPHGLHDENHYTTPYDLALIFQQGLKYPYFTEVIKRLYYQIPKTNMTEAERNLYSKNAILLQKSSYYYPSCGGGKTGFTDQAMYTLVTHAQRDGMHLMAVVMKAPLYGHYTDTAALYEYGFNFFRSQRIFDRYSYSKEIPVYQDDKDEPIERGIVLAQAGKGIKKTARIDMLENLEQKITLPDKLKAPVKKGDVIGKLALQHNGATVAEVDLLAVNGLEAWTEEEIRQMKLDALLEQIKKHLPILLTFIPLTILIVVALVSLVRRRRRRKQW